MEYSSRAKQIGIYFGKRKREFQNSKGLIKTILYTLCISLLLLTVLGEDIFLDESESQTRFFILSCICIFYGLFNSLESVCSEREIIKHEHRGGMYLSAYIFGNAAFDFLICLIHAAVTWAVVMARYLPNIIEQNGGYAFLMVPGYLLTMIIITSTADALGLCISSIVKTPYQAMKVMPFVMILQIAFANIFIDLPARMTWISKFTLSKWGTNAMFDVAFDTKDQSISDAFVSLFGLSAPEYPDFFSCWLILLLFTILFIGLSILFLRSVDKDQR